METVAVSSSRSRLLYDAFLSFRGFDTRHNITEALYEELHRKGKVRVFRDNEGMKRGDEISPSLIAAIEDSAGAVFVLSHNYANSKWCLDELVMLSDLSASMRRPMIPIFVGVIPSHVRKQSDHFAADFVKHAKTNDEEKIRRWRRAMNLVGNLPGFVCSKYTAEKYKSLKKKEKADDKIRPVVNMVIAEEDKKIIERVDDMVRLMVKRVVAEVINTPDILGEYTVGIESRVEDLVKLFDIEASSGVQILGLYGRGGIGKTTLAKAFYNKVIAKFEKHRVFISNVSETSLDKDGLVGLQKTFIDELFHSVPQIEDVNKGREKIREEVHEKKILAVLDDVDSIDQVDAVVGESRWYGHGTLIVITTKNKEILNSLSVNQQYEVKCLTEMEALKLFSYHSQRKAKPTDSLLDLSTKIVKITGLLPLSVEVFGSLLYDKKEEEKWRVQLKKLKHTQSDRLQDILALSFESLDEEEKKVFLDIACLFLKTDITMEEVVDILKGCGLNAEAALGVLRQKSLVKIMADGTLWMHDQVRDMGREMVINECCEDPGTRSRLWDHGEIMTVLNDMKGKRSIRGIVFDLKKKFGRDPRAEDIALRNLQNNPGIKSLLNYVTDKFLRSPAEEKPTNFAITIPVEAFVPMKKLRLLQINHVKLEGNLNLLPPELKWIQWKGCPLEYFPLNFLSEQLAVLDLSESGIRRVQSLASKGVDGNLKVVNLRGCHNLEAIPDLSNHKSLTKLYLEGCMLLVEVPSHVGDLNKLLHLDLRNCSKLTKFLEDVSGLKCLEKLFLSGCSNLRELPDNIGAMPCLKELLLDGTAIKNLPESVFRLGKLAKLSLKGCRSIQELPLSITLLTSLEELYLNDTALENLPDLIGNLKNLQKLHLARCGSLSKIPESINALILLKELFINGSAVEEIPLKEGSLPCLTDLLAGDCEFLKEVPVTIGGLNSLLRLQLDSTPIKTLPKGIRYLRFIRTLELRNCKSLRFLPKSIGYLDTLQSLYLQGSNVVELPKNFGRLENLVVLQMNNCEMLKKLPESFGNLKSLHYLYMEETLVAELPDSFGNLSNLRVLKMLKQTFSGCSKELPNSFSNLSKLEELNARCWGISGKIPDAFENLSAMKILNLGNNYFHSLPASLKGLSNLRELSLCDCRELKCLPPLPSKLELLNLANCFALESITDLSDLGSLQELNLTNCDKLYDIPGLEHLKALKRLYMSGCNSECFLAVKKILSKASLKMLRHISLPGNRVPSWFSQSPPRFSAKPNRNLIGVILAFVVSLNNESRTGDGQLPRVQAQILRVGQALYTDTFHISGVPRTSDDLQLHICQYSAFHPMVTKLKDGCTVVIQREPSAKGIMLKTHGVHLVYEEEDNGLTNNEDSLTETVSQKLAKIFSTFKEG